MWGDMSPRVKLTGDFGHAIEGIRISNRLPPLVFAKNSWRCNFRLLQQYPPHSVRLAAIRVLRLCATTRLHAVQQTVSFIRSPRRRGRGVPVALLSQGPSQLSS